MGRSGVKRRRSAGAAERQPAGGDAPPTKKARPAPQLQSEGAAKLEDVFAAAVPAAIPQVDVKSLLAPPPHSQKPSKVLKKRRAVRRCVALVDQQGRAKPVPRTKAEEHERLQRTIFVSNLPNNARSDELVRLFRQCGEVESARIRQQVFDAHPERGAFHSAKVNLLAGRLSEHGSCGGFVVFRDAASIEQALALDGVSFGKVRKSGAGVDNVIQVDRAGQTADPFSSEDSLFLGNVLMEASDQQVREHFTSKGIKVARVRLVREPRTHKCKGFGFVRFASAADLQKALATKGAELLGRELRMKRVQGRSRETDERMRKARTANQGTPQLPQGPKSKKRKLREAEERAQRRVQKRAAASWEGTHSRQDPSRLPRALQGLSKPWRSKLQRKVQQEKEQRQRKKARHSARKERAEKKHKQAGKKEQRSH